MNQNPESLSATNPSGQSRQGPLRDESGRGARSSAGDDEGRSLTSEARQVASNLAEQATRSAERQFASGKERAAQAVGQFAEALRHTGETMSSGTDMPAIREYLGRAASQAEGLSEYLRDKSLSDVVGDVERFARREPVFFVGGAFLIGLLGGRFLKSSHSEGSTYSANARQGGKAGR
jgi:hypothetical protein